jgi:hypothetical protein
MQHDHTFMTKAILFITAVACVVCVMTAVTVFIQNDDTTTLSAACIAITAVIAVMPWQLASLQHDRGSLQFALLVRSGIYMSYGALCFTAATILKYGMLQYLAENKEDGLSKSLQIFSSVFFLLASIVTSIGFYKFV